MKLGNNRNTAHTALVRACVEYLRLRGVVCWQQNVGAIRRGTHLYRVAPAGTPDVLGYLPPTGRGIAVECKTGSGKANKDQVAWHERARAAGVLVLVVRDVRDLEQALEGAERREVL